MTCDGRCEVRCVTAQTYRSISVRVLFDSWNMAFFSQSTVRYPPVMLSNVKDQLMTMVGLRAA